MTCAAVGIVLHQTILRGAVYQPEDFVHRSDNTCIFSRGLEWDGIVNALDHLFVCEGCRKFYADAGLPELIQWGHTVVRGIDAQRMDRSIRRRTSKRKT